MDGFVFADVQVVRFRADGQIGAVGDVGVVPVSEVAMQRTSPNFFASVKAFLLQPPVTIYSAAPWGMRFMGSMENCRVAPP